MSSYKVISYTRPTIHPLEGNEHIQGNYKTTTINYINYTITDKNGCAEKRQFKVPKGFIFDGASIPKALWSVTGSPYLPSFIAAAMYHDFHCHILDGKEGYEQYGKVQLKEISEVFYQILLKEGVGKFRAKSMYYAVLSYKRFF